MAPEKATFAVSLNIYDNLMRRVFDKYIKLLSLPAFATSWEAINDITWLFHLRKGVKFHNGEDFNAESVKYTVERLFDPATKATWKGNLSFIDHVEIVDPYAVKIITKTPAPLLKSAGSTSPQATARGPQTKGPQTSRQH